MGLRSRGTAFLAHPVYNLFSAALTIAGILLLIGTAVADLKLSTAQLLKRADLALLGFFFLETMLRIVFERGKYVRQSLILDSWALCQEPLKAAQTPQLADEYVSLTSNNFGTFA